MSDRYSYTHRNDLNEEITVPMVPYKTQDVVVGLKQTQNFRDEKVSPCRLYTEDYTLADCDQ